MLSDLSLNGEKFYFDDDLKTRENWADPKKRAKINQYLVIKEPGEPDGEHLEHAGLQQGHLVVVLQTLEAGYQLGEGTHLQHIYDLLNGCTICVQLLKIKGHLWIIYIYAS